MESECECGLVWDEAARCPWWPRSHCAGDGMIRNQNADLWGANEKRFLGLDHDGFGVPRYLGLGSADLRIE